jgi:rsbT antagonist protein RsbS
MNHNHDADDVLMYKNYGCLVVPLDAELRDHTLARTKDEVLAKVQETRVKGVIVDFSAVSVIDSYAGELLNDTARAVSLLGATVVISGIKPGTAASLVDLDLYFDGITKVPALEEALRILRPAAANQGETSHET